MEQGWSVNPTFAFFLALPAVAFVFMIIPFLLGRAFLKALLDVVRGL